MKSKGHLSNAEVLKYQTPGAFTTTHFLPGSGQLQSDQFVAAWRRTGQWLAGGPPMAVAPLSQDSVAWETPLLHPPRRALLGKVQRVEQIARIGPDPSPM